MKDWITYNWKLILAIIGFAVLSSSLLIFELMREKLDPESQKVSERCLELVQEVEGLELDGAEAKLVPIGRTAYGASYSGLMMVWNKDVSGVSVNCSIVSHGTKVRRFAINGEDKTHLIGR